MHHARRSFIYIPAISPSFSPGLSSVIGMKGNGPERGRKETFLHSYLLTPTVGGANSHTGSHRGIPVCAHTHTQTVYPLQDDGRNNIGLIAKHIKGKIHLARGISEDERI